MPGRRRRNGLDEELRELARDVASDPSYASRLRLAVARARAGQLDPIVAAAVAEEAKDNEAAALEEEVGKILAFANATSEQYLRLKVRDVANVADHAMWKRPEQTMWMIPRGMSAHAELRSAWTCGGGFALYPDFVAIDERTPIGNITRDEQRELNNRFTTYALVVMAGDEFKGTTAIGARSGIFTKRGTVYDADEWVDPTISFAWSSISGPTWANLGYLGQWQDPRWSPDFKTNIEKGPLELWRDGGVENRRVRAPTPLVQRWLLLRPLLFE